MSHTLTKITATGMFETTTKRTANEILINVNPGGLPTLSIYYSDVDVQTFTPTEGSPEIKIVGKSPVGVIQVSFEELSALPSFAAVQADLQQLADRKSAEQWPVEQP